MNHFSPFHRILYAHNRLQLALDLPAMNEMNHPLGVMLVPPQTWSPSLPRSLMFCSDGIEQGVGPAFQTQQAQPLQLEMTRNVSQEQQHDIDGHDDYEESEYLSFVVPQPAAQPFNSNAELTQCIMQQQAQTLVTQSTMNLTSRSSSQKSISIGMSMLDKAKVSQ
jgi:hypothetical protein